MIAPPRGEGWAGRSQAEGYPRSLPVRARDAIPAILPLGFSGDRRGSEGEIRGPVLG